MADGASEMNEYKAEGDIKGYFPSASTLTGRKAACTKTSPIPLINDGYCFPLVESQREHHSKHTHQNQHKRYRNLDYPKNKAHKKPKRIQDSMPNPIPE
ncbi:uncharacterized protein BDZ99DRAFT_126564 [Mytilinidion resinicola]|uniref:Uncharacterized protein n=1 Tax=Mytilinidion resinicola TaxID=574789 RepID=A0A6A6Z5G9_9PEZI|nr:uncharacterized protein BDZ99DRAFT_126564 [Mytilinidion resinicola]KAF2815979.1 hypothetical protein BDZ99DRAFT_126564 [Mytilinidion resinicola]